MIIQWIVGITETEVSSGKRITNIFAGGNGVIRTGRCIVNGADIKRQCPCLLTDVVNLTAVTVWQLPAVLQTERQ